MTMANDLADLYDSLILKTKEKQLVWVEDPNGAALTARVGDLLIRVSGLILRGERLSSNAFTQAIRAQNAAAAIAVYDKEAKLVARGGRVVNYMNPQSGHQAAITMLTTEDISSPKLAELASLLEGIHNKGSVASTLLQALKAS
jgi:hypothetical protein